MKIFPVGRDVAELGHGATGGFVFFSVGKGGIYGEYGVWDLWVDE